MKTQQSSTITTTSLNLACYLIMCHCLLKQVIVYKPGTRKYALKVIFVGQLVRRIRKSYDKNTCYITPENLTVLMENIYQICGKKPLENYQQGLFYLSKEGTLHSGYLLKMKHSGNTQTQGGKP
jgi:hypothetical protein